MPFTIESLVRIRPYIYHLTSSQNFQRIQRQRELYSASDLLDQSGDSGDMGIRRGETSMEVGNEKVSLRDQDPLHEGNIEFEEGWDFARLLKLLNSKVFFWPGKDEGPISYGQRHYERYQHEEVVVLRAPLNSVLLVNDRMTPQFCMYNSGSPRCSNGRRSPRGSKTFVPCGKAEYSASKVVEIVFAKHVALPPDTQYAKTPYGDWKSVFDE